MIYEVKIFEVPRLAIGVKFLAHVHKPVELEMMTVEGRDTESARRSLTVAFKKAGKQVRSINAGPNDAGIMSFVVYLHGKTIKP